MFVTNCSRKSLCRASSTNWKGNLPSMTPCWQRSCWRRHQRSNGLASSGCSWRPKMSQKSPIGSGCPRGERSSVINRQLARPRSTMTFQGLPWRRAWRGSAWWASSWTCSWWPCGGSGRYRRRGHGRRRGPSNKLENCQRNFPISDGFTKWFFSEVF